MTHDEVIAWIDREIIFYLEQVRYGIEINAIQYLIEQNKNQLNSWLAHKAFFERHGRNVDGKGFPDFCKPCDVYYPCPELVAQAKAIMGATE